MTNYEYILSECKKAHYGKWTQEATDACIYRLNGLTRDELMRLFTSRWLTPKNKLREAIFGLLFKEKIEARASMIRDASEDELGEMLIEKDGNYVKLARHELMARYQQASHDVQIRIIGYFLKAQSKQDRKWGEVREKWQKRGFANPPSIFDSLKH